MERFEEFLQLLGKKVETISSLPYFKEMFNSEVLEKFDDVYHIASLERGIGLVLSQDFTLLTIHLKANKFQGSKQFIGPLPTSISFNSSQDAVREILGRPFKFSGGQKLGILYDFVPFWDKYQISKYFLHFQYSKDRSSIDLITLSLK